MRAELIAIGSELLLGEGVDTNSAWIASRLAEIGVDVHRHVTVGDNPQRLGEVLRESLARADAVIMTGGLGPTQDDLTRDVVAAVAGVELERHDDLVEQMRALFVRRGRSMPDRNLVQADIPVGATVLDPVGTAAGFALPIGEEIVYAVPGVPREMRAMVAGQVIGDLQRRGGLFTVVSRRVHTAGMSESAVAEDLAPVVERLDAQAQRTDVPGSVPTIAFLASRGATRVRITAKGADRTEARSRLDPVTDEVIALLGEGVAGVDDEAPEFVVARMMTAQRLTLAVGESVTGGALGARLATVPGATGWFRGGLITYATDTKPQVAGVDADLLARCGPVSEEVAGALARGARDRFEADVGLGLVGVAGPATQHDQPVGTLCVGWVFGCGETEAATLRLPIGGADSDEVADAVAIRTEVQQWAVGAAVDRLRRLLVERGRA